MVSHSVGNHFLILIFMYVATSIFRFITYNAKVNNYTMSLLQSSIVASWLLKNRRIFYKNRHNRNFLKKGKEPSPVESSEWMHPVKGCGLWWCFKLVANKVVTWQRFPYESYHFWWCCFSCWWSNPGSDSPWSMDSRTRILEISDTKYLKQINTVSNLTYVAKVLICHFKSVLKLNWLLYYSSTI